jgi:hypothetical protein
MLAGVLVLSCGERPTPAEPGPPSFRTSNNPDGPGAIVTRSDELVGFANCDAEADICYLMGSSLEYLIRQCEEGLPPEDPATRLIVVRPDGSVHLLFRAKDAHLLVWDAPADFCADQPFAIGTGQLIVVENSGVNRFGFRLHGTVSALADGQRYHLFNMLHLIVPPDGEARITSFQFRFTPIGG